MHQIDEVKLVIGLKVLFFLRSSLRNPNQTSLLYLFNFKFLYTGTLEVGTYENFKAPQNLIEVFHGIFPVIQHRYTFDNKFGLF